MDNAENTMDIDFSVPFVHRLRFTGSLWEREESALLKLLVPPPGQKTSVQFWLDDGVANAWPELKHRIRILMGSRPDLDLAGNVQIIAGGETAKNDVHLLERMLKVLNAHHLDRQSYVVAIGGGAVLDAVGFAAAIAHRGIRLIRVPTTTLSQADSGLGVKNGINLFGKKNWVGAFAVPWAVINDQAILQTLSDRDFRAGFSEAVKVALLKDAEFFQQLSQSADEIAQRDTTTCDLAIRESAMLHLRHITDGGDPFEMQESRPLDFGHWSAHKLEALTDFELRHGEAVAIGVAIDTVYSALKHGLSDETANEVLRILTTLGFALYHPVLDDYTALFRGLEEFREHLGGRLTLTMLDGVAAPIEIHEVDLPAMEAALSKICDYGRTQPSR